MNSRSRAPVFLVACLAVTGALHCGSKVQQPRTPASTPPGPNPKLVADSQRIGEAQAAASRAATLATDAANEVATAKQKVTSAGTDAVALASANADLDYAKAKAAAADAGVQASKDAEALAERQLDMDRATGSAVAGAAAKLEAAAEQAALSAAKARVLANALAKAADDRTATFAAGAPANQAQATVKAAAGKIDATDALTSASQITNLNNANAATPPKASATPAEQTQIEFATGGRLSYGLSASLLEFNVERPNNQPGRLRQYQPNLQVIPPQLGFQFTYEPPTSPWRLKKSDGSSYQLISVGGTLLVQVDNASNAQGAIALGGTLNFFGNLLGIGVAIDLYRGIPTLGSNGVAGSSTAYTGFLSWAFAPQGEVTPEDVSVVLIFGLDPIVHALSGVVK